ncbi:MAG: PepSY domain-containing protein [Anaerolineae bacterium]|nr:PepSY domain-containing protein [Anaerolineae bacterium]
MSNRQVWAKKVVLAAVTASALVAAAQPLLAQTATPLPALLPTIAAPITTVELRGIISALDAATLTLNNQIVNITGVQMPPGAGVGQRMRVYAALIGPNQWQAYSVELFNGAVSSATPTPNIAFLTALPPTVAPIGTPLPTAVPPAVGQPQFAREFELVGILESVNDQTIVVSGLPISIIGANIRTALTPGMPLELDLYFAEGVLTAREVDDEDNLLAGGRVVGAPMPAASAVAIMSSLLPNAIIREIELDRDVNGLLIWEIHTTDGQKMYIDAQTGVVLAIELSNFDDGYDDHTDDLNDDSDHTDDHDDDQHDDQNDDDDEDDGDDD